MRVGLESEDLSRSASAVTAPSKMMGDGNPIWECATLREIEDPKSFNVPERAPRRSAHGRRVRGARWVRVPENNLQGAHEQGSGPATEWG